MKMVLVAGGYIPAPPLSNPISTLMQDKCFLYNIGN